MGNSLTKTNMVFIYLVRLPNLWYSPNTDQSTMYPDRKYNFYITDNSVNKRHLLLIHKCFDDLERLLE